MDGQAAGTLVGQSGADVVSSPIVADCSNVQIGVWSESHFDRTVVVAVYGKGDSAPPVLSDIRDFGQVPGWTP